MPTPAEIKKALQAAGFEVYRTRGDVVHLAERVRENLLMDAGVFVRVSDVSDVSGAAEPLRVGFVLRAQRSDFPNEPEEGLFARARSLAEAARDRGYREAGAEVRRVLDPGDSERTLDVWCEVEVEKMVSDLEAALEEARFALSLERAAVPR